MYRPSPLSTYEHPLDVLTQIRQAADDGKPCALAIVTQTEGGAVRAPGALMAILSETEAYGYVSGGCIDADVRLNALAAMDDKAPRPLRYGIGSKFQDIQLPCGGAIDLLILPQPDLTALDAIANRLRARKDAAVAIDAGGHLTLASQATKPLATYRPRLKLRIAGRGADCLALARLVEVSGFEAELCLVDETDIAAARAANLTQIAHLTSPADLPTLTDDAATAFVLMFHDDGWETALLQQALTGPAFYIGAVGSRKTHARRSQKLLDSGVSQSEINRIHGPIGLVPSLRDASMLAVSTLAEIVDAFHAGKMTS